jgi:hypothetical protein
MRKHFGNEWNAIQKLYAGNLKDVRVYFLYGSSLSVTPLSAFEETPELKENPPTHWMIKLEAKRELHPRYFIYSKDWKVAAAGEPFNLTDVTGMEVELDENRLNESSASIAERALLFARQYHTAEEYRRRFICETLIDEFERLNHTIGQAGLIEIQKWIVANRRDGNVVKTKPLRNSPLEEVPSARRVSQSA